ncbi:MAG: SDR family NAD(P)-dependent oxidoreductase [Lachnospiraceae bacterium]|nr:SDR family NAD(P)-dependent oxidoreductase [Lachnospiraceae bacterium]
MKIAIVTGASSGMGREFVRQIRKNYRSLDEIWMIARTSKRLEAMARELEKESNTKKRAAQLKTLPMDLCSTEDMEHFRELLRNRKPCVCLLVNGAGVGAYGPAAHLSMEEQLRMIDLNCRALTQMTLFCLPYLSRGSQILQLASGSAFLPQPKFAVYGAGKAYVVSFSRALHRELKGRKITVTSVCPGPVDTEFFAHGGISLPWWKRPFLATPEPVVQKALLDAQAGRTFSLYGRAIKLVRFLSRIL